VTIKVNKNQWKSGKFHTGVLKTPELMVTKFGVNWS